LPCAYQFKKNGGKRCVHNRSVYKKKIKRQKSIILLMNNGKRGNIESIAHSRGIPTGTND